MTINVPVDTSLVSTNVEDAAPLWQNTVKQDFAKDTEVKYDGGVYQNLSGAAIISLAYNSQHTYAVGDIVYKEGKIRVKSDFFGNVPKAPQDYDGFDTEMLNDAWTHRYVKIADFVDWNNGLPAFNYTDAYETYAVTIFPHASSLTGWYYECVFTEVPTVYKIITEVEVLSAIGADTVELEPTTSASKPYPGYWGANTVIVNEQGVFARTNVAVSAEYFVGDSFTYDEAVSPADIGFTYTMVADEQSPFDDRQYTSVVRSSAQTWVAEAAARFSGVAISRLRGASIDVVFKDPLGNVVGTPIAGRTVNDTIDANIEPEPTTDFIYAGTWIDQGGTVEITVNTAGLDTEVGYIMLFATVEVMAPTNLEFSNETKNFDREVQSAISGHIDNIRGNRYIIYKGSFDITMLEYDKWILLSKKLTNTLAAIDGSDMKANEQADGITRFNATRMICRIKKLAMASKVKDGDMEKVVPVDFEFREVV